MGPPNERHDQCRRNRPKRLSATTASIKSRAIKKKASVVDITASPISCSNYTQVCEWLRHPLVGAVKFAAIPLAVSTTAAGAARR